MPTILRWKGFRFFFFSNEGDEPPHVHAEKDDSTVKFWLDPVIYASSSGFSDREIRTLAEKVKEHHDEFLEAWHGYFKTR